MSKHNFRQIYFYMSAKYGGQESINNAQYNGLEDEPDGSRW